MVKITHPHTKRDETHLVSSFKQISRKRQAYTSFSTDQKKKKQSQTIL